MSEKKIWIAIAVGFVLAGGSFGTMIYFKQEDIDVSRAEASDLKTRIAAARKTIESTTGLEREVIVLREISEVIDQILPDTEDLNNLVDDFYQYAVDSRVASTSFKRKPDRTSGRGQIAR